MRRRSTATACSSLWSFHVFTRVLLCCTCCAVPQMLMDLGKPTYEADFEQAFLADAAKFYKKEAAEYIACSNAPDYMRKVCISALIRQQWCWSGPCTSSWRQAHSVSCSPALFSGASVDCK